MKFYNRDVELKLLEKNDAQSHETACFQVVVGRRRIGKTSLLMESVKGKKVAYLFVMRKNEHLLCSEFQRLLEQIGLKIFGTVASFKDLFEQVMKYAIDEHFTLIIDEFQEFEYVNPSIFSDIQFVWDQYKSKINLIVCGSVYSLMTRIFEHNKEPLFGRLTSKLILQSFKVDTVKEILTDYNPNYKNEDLLCLYAVTGGVAKYIELLMDAKAKNKDEFLEFICRMDSPFLTEGKELLISEFGREYGTYFSILQLIASGKTSQREIDSIVGKNTGAYLVNLEEDYSLIVRKRPLFSKPNSRNVKWALNDNYLQFWFRFIYPNQSLIEIARYDLLKEIIESGYEQYSGAVLENYFREKLVSQYRITEIGEYWDNKKQNEIDIVALNDMDREAFIAEVKRNPKEIDLIKLRSKSVVIKKELANFRVAYLALSLEDM
ncbi:ATP-binding protein [Sphingobacterium suaedae]|uniref:ATP-binding protein n=1 Tax=Sphingobacterium suaedae TaxID=1686402 RepID=A0ABW5KKV8_9SPHI